MVEEEVIPEGVETMEEEILEGDLLEKRETSILENRIIKICSLSLT